MDSPSGGDMTAAFSSALEGATSPAVAETSPVSTPAPEATPADTSTAAAIAQPAAETPAPVPASADAPEETGAPPKWRWQDILANTRETVAKETEARIRQELQAQTSTLSGVDPAELQGFRVMQAALAGDQRAIAQIKQNPEAMQALRSMVAEQHAAAEAAQEAAPEADLTTHEGALVFSAAQQSKREAWLERKWEQKFEQRLQELLSPFAGMLQAQQSATVHAEVAGVVAQFTSDPEFVKHKADVRHAINSDRKLSALAGSDPQAALELAWARVYRDKVVPALSQNSEAKTLAHLQQRAVAGTVHPSAPTAGTPKKFSKGEQGFAEALAHFGATA